MFLSVQALSFFIFLCAVGGTQAVLICFSEVVTLRGKGKRQAPTGLALLGENIHSIDIKGHQGFTKIRH